MTFDKEGLALLLKRQKKNSGITPTPSGATTFDKWVKDYANGVFGWNPVEDPVEWMKDAWDASDKNTAARFEKVIEAAEKACRHIKSNF